MQSVSITNTNQFTQYKEVISFRYDDKHMKHIYCMCVRASYMKLTRDTHLMQQFIYYYKQLYMFRSSICPVIHEIDERYPLDATIYLLL